MKHIKIASAIAIAMGLAAGTASAADGGVITFHGVVTDTTCTIQGGSGTDGGENNFSVTLDGVDAGALATSGTTANAKAFQIVVGGPGQESCGAGEGKVATMSFVPSSPRVDAATGNLSNALGSQAKNVQVQLLQQDGTTVIDLRDPASGQQNADITNNQATLQYYAQYFATGAATPGLVQTNVTYAVDYN